jgi:hypothetical protein
MEPAGPVAGLVRQPMWTGYHNSIITVGPVSDSSEPIHREYLSVVIRWMPMTKPERDLLLITVMLAVNIVVNLLILVGVR